MLLFWGKHQRHTMYHQLNLRCRLEHVSFSYNRLEDEVCSSVVKMFFGQSWFQGGSHMFTPCSGDKSDKWDIVGPSQHIPFQLPGFSRWQLVTNAMPTAWWFVGWGLPPTRSWNTWSWMATAWVWQPLRSWWRVCKATRPSRSSLMAITCLDVGTIWVIHRYTVNTVWVDKLFHSHSFSSSRFLRS